MASGGDPASTLPTLARLQASRFKEDSGMAGWQSQRAAVGEVVLPQGCKGPLPSNAGIGDGTVAVNSAALMGPALLS